MKELNNPDKAKTAKGPELRIIDIGEVVGWDHNIRLCLEPSAAEWARFGAAKRRDCSGVDAAHAYLRPTSTNDPLRDRLPPKPARRSSICWLRSRAGLARNRPSA